MKRMKRIASLAVVLVLLMCVAATVNAAPATYKVTVSGGLYGEDKGVFDVTAGTMFTPPNQADYGKYYWKGYHIAGREGLVGSVQVDRDMEFVASYGMKGTMVSYTIHFVENGTTNVLHAPATYYGNVGDKPVSSYVYINGYEPQAYNITGTLTSGTNDWTLYYNKIVTPTPVPDNGGGGGGGGGNAGGEVPGGDIVVNPGNGGNAGQQPQNIIDVDEQQAPLAGPGTEATPDPNTAAGQKEENLKLGTLFAAIGGSSALTILLGLLVAFFKKGLFG